jgi:hypothetical protein
VAASSPIPFVPFSLRISEPSDNFSKSPCKMNPKKTRNQVGYNQRRNLIQLSESESDRPPVKWKKLSVKNSLRNFEAQGCRAISVLLVRAAN